MRAYAVRRRMAVTGLVAILLTLLGVGQLTPTSAQDASPIAASGTAAAAVIYGTEGQVVGTALLTEQPDGSVVVVVTAAGLEPGEHGLHAHETGQCDPEGERAFSSAGGHFNPTEAEHGDHAGDLGNITVDDDGIGRYEETTDAFTLTSGDPMLLDDDGAAIVIHANPDENDPDGESFGARIACGVLTTTPPAMDADADLGATPVA